MCSIALGKHSSRGGRRGGRGGRGAHVAGMGCILVGRGSGQGVGAKEDVRVVSVRVWLWLGEDLGVRLRHTR